MTPEQQAKLDEIVALLGEKRDEVYDQLRKADPENGDKTVAEKVEAMDQVANDLNASLMEHFGITPGESPLLAIGIANILGSNLRHAMSHIDDMEPNQLLVLIAETMFGMLEGLTHAALQSVQPENAG